MEELQPGCEPAERHWSQTTVWGSKESDKELIAFMKAVHKEYHGEFKLGAFCDMAAAS
jgi:hypothetical protein